MRSPGDRAPFGGGQRAARARNCRAIRATPKSEGSGSGVPNGYGGRRGRVCDPVLVEDQVGLCGVPGVGLAGVLQGWQLRRGLGQRGFVIDV